MQLGEFELTTVSGGNFRIDAGTMFGVVPKALWGRSITVDDNNRMPNSTHCVLIRTAEKTLLLETGYGSKLSDKQRHVFAAEEGDPLLASLQEQGVSAEDIDTVILSHLHFDHAGGATRRAEDGTVQPTFPNATYVAQRREWVIATADYPELRGAYPQENLLPLAESGQLTLIDGDVEIAPGIRAFVTGGHTVGHQAVYIESGGETAVFLGDICPTAAHLRSLWCMSYDVDLLQTRRVKPKLLGQIADNGWLAVWDHDPDMGAARLRRDPKREFVVGEAVTRL